MNDAPQRNFPRKPNAHNLFVIILSKVTPSGSRRNELEIAHRRRFTPFNIQSNFLRIAIALRFAEREC
jgi:hypothetical protein